VCAGSVAGLARPGQTQSCERNHANVTFYFFLIHESVARGIPLMLENLRRFPRAAMHTFQLQGASVIWSLILKKSARTDRPARACFLSSAA
jgi:hypothetical protein